MNETKTTIDILKQLEDKLDPYLSDSLRESRFYVDLSDIHEICCSYIKAIDGILSAEDGDAISNSLYQIDNELFEHLPYHSKSLRKLLDLVIDELEKVQKSQK